MKKWASVLAVCVIACICFILFLDGHIRSEKPMSEDNYIIVDIRTAEEYKEGHVIGAVNIPFDKINENVELNKEKTIIVYCQEGNESNTACTVLRELGYEAFDLGTYNTITLKKE